MEYKMTLQEFYDKIKSGEFTVDFGRAFLDFPEQKRMKYLLDTLESELDRLEDISEKFDEEIVGKDGTKTTFGKLFGHPADIMEDKGVLRLGGLFNDSLNLHSFLLNEKLYFALNGTHITFKQRIILNGGMKSYMDDPQVPEDIEEPAFGEINLPTKHIILANYFRFNEVPENERWGKKYDLCSVVGRKTRTQYYANANNVAYGQMGNMSVGVFTNGSEIIIGDSYAEDRMLDNEHCLKKYRDEYSEEEIQEMEKENANIKQFLTFLQEGKFENKGSISLSVWRWEATDYERGIEDLDKNENKGYMDVIDFPVNGTKARFEHYFEGIGEKYPNQPFPQVYSRIWITE